MEIGSAIMLAVLSASAQAQSTPSSTQTLPTVTVNAAEDAAPQDGHRATTTRVGKVLQDPVLARIAAKHQATVAQVALAWALQLGYAVIPSSTRREHLASNLRAQDLALDAEDMAAIATLERHGREVNPEGLAPAWD